METKICRLFADKKPVNTHKKLYPNEIYKNPRLAIENHSLGKLHPDCIRVAMQYAGICGTDVHLVQTNKTTGYILCSAPLDIKENGLLIGHEGAGYTLDVGSNVKHIEKHQYVVFESILTCKYCTACRNGNFNQCINSKLLGMELDGLFGTIVDVPAGLAHDITSLVKKNAQNLMAAACIEPASVAYVACENADIQAADNVLIFGAGPIGVFIAILVKQIFGVSSVSIAEPVEFRRNFAKKYCDEVFTVEEVTANPPLNIDVIFEASGYLEGINTIFTHLNANARIVLLARLGNALIIKDMDHLITNRIKICGSRGHLGGAFDKIIRLMEHNRIDLSQVITGIGQGVEDIVYYLQDNPDRILNENCKIIVKLNDRL